MSAEQEQAGTAEVGVHRNGQPLVEYCMRSDAGRLQATLRLTQLGYVATARTGLENLKTG